MGDSNMPTAMMAGQAKAKTLIIISYNRSSELILNGSRPNMETCCGDEGGVGGVASYQPHKIASGQITHSKLFCASSKHEPLIRKFV